MWHVFLKLLFVLLIVLFIWDLVWHEPRSSSCDACYGAGTFGFAGDDASMCSDSSPKERIGWFFISVGKNSSLCWRYGSRCHRSCQGFAVQWFIVWRRLKMFEDVWTLGSGGIGIGSRGLGSIGFLWISICVCSCHWNCGVKVFALRDLREHDPRQLIFLMRMQKDSCKMHAIL